MQALRIHEFSTPPTVTLDEIDAPRPAAGEVLVQVHASAISFVDLLRAEGKYQLLDTIPWIGGSECAGVVTAVGDGVTGLKVGDAVACLVRNCWAQQVCVAQDLAYRVRAGADLVAASALPAAYCTALYGLRERGNVKAGETVLVLGASGSVGYAAVEVAHLLGARVIAACSSQEKVDLAIKHGADAGVVYGRGPFDRDGQKALGALFKEAGGAEGFNVIYDAIGGDYAEPALRSIAWEGRYLVVGFAAGDIPKIPLNLALLKGCDIVGVFWGTWAARNPELFSASIDELLELYAQGKVKPHVSERFPLERGADAIAHLGSRQAMGKVVVTID